MTCLDKTKVEKYIEDKIDGYRKRNAIRKPGTIDYTDRIMAMDNLRAKIKSGDFDVKPEQTKTD